MSTRPGARSRGRTHLAPCLLHSVRLLAGMAVSGAEACGIVFPLGCELLPDLHGQQNNQG